jgi:hypothetical protein
MRLQTLMLVPIAALSLIGAALAADAAAAPVGLAEIGAWGIATALTGAIVYVCERLLGIKIDSAHRASLHLSLRTGAGLFIASMTELLAKGVSPAEAKQLALQKGLDYVRQAAPDPIARFKLHDDDFLADMLTSTATQLKLGAGMPSSLTVPAPAA